VTKFLEITLIEAVKARAQLRARNWVIKRQANGKTYIVSGKQTKPVADGLVAKAVSDLDHYHYKQSLESEPKSNKEKIEEKVKKFTDDRLADPNLSDKAKEVYKKAKEDSEKDSY
jgi:hypothetical protein